MSGQDRHRSTSGPTRSDAIPEVATPGTAPGWQTRLMRRHRGLAAPSPSPARRSADRPSPHPRAVAPKRLRPKATRWLPSRRSRYCSRLCPPWDEECSEADNRRHPDANEQAFVLVPRKPERNRQHERDRRGQQDQHSSSTCLRRCSAASRTNGGLGRLGEVLREWTHVHVLSLIPMHRPYTLCSYSVKCWPCLRPTQILLRTKGLNGILTPCRRPGNGRN